VPSPLPDFDPAPGPTGGLDITFSSPLVPVRQDTTHTTVAWTVSHDIVDGVLVRLIWPLVRGGSCPAANDEVFDYAVLPFDSPTAETGLRHGFCYRWEALAFDENGEFGDVVSASVSVTDHIRPTIRSRTPTAGAGHVSPKISPRVVFSESVGGVSATTVRIKNLSTNRWVRVKVTYNAATTTVTIDPRLWMFRHERYAIYLSSNIRDGSGNRLTATHWSFTTGP